MYQILHGVIGKKTNEKRTRYYVRGYQKTQNKPVKPQTQEGTNGGSRPWRSRSLPSPSSTKMHGYTIPVYTTR